MDDTKLVICEKCLGTGHVNGCNENSTWSKTCEGCHGIGFSIAKKTNADRIRAMSDDELAAFLCNLRSEEAYENTCSHCVAERFCRIGHTGMIDWIQQPAEGE